MYAGVDEAGRGPVLGPLVVAGVQADPTTLPDGIDDSKTLSPSERESLAQALEDDPDVRTATRVITAAELNEAMDDGRTLDEIEQAAFVAVLETLGASEAIVDTVGPSAGAFGARLTTALEDSCTVEARREADATDPVVGAASILAKVERDARVTTLAEEIDEEIGSGYPSDPATRAFLSDWRDKHTTPPPFARTAWSTLETLGFGSAKLTEFEGGSP